MVFSDINFYIILILGFAVYIFWGLILGFILTEWKKMKSISEKLKPYYSKLEGIQLELSNVSGEVQEFEDRITNIEEVIHRNLQKISRFESGSSVPVSRNEIRSMAANFTGGFMSYANLYLVNNEIGLEKLSKKINELQSNWINSELELLNSQNNLID